jgi:hypothetical protein
LRFSVDQIVENNFCMVKRESLDRDHRLIKLQMDFGSYLRGSQDWDLRLTELKIKILVLVKRDC